MNQKLLLIVLCALAAGTIAQCASVDDGQATAVRQGFRLPNLFNFEQFKAMFHKHYQSLAEELMRQRLFLARAFNAFISMVKFRHFQSDYYLSVNPRSDETPEERMRHRMHLDQLGGHDPVNVTRPLSDEERRRLEVGESEPQQVPAMEPSELREKLAQIEEHKSEPEYKPMADELERLQKDGVDPSETDDEDEVQEVRSKRKNPAQDMLRDFAANVMKNPLAENIMRNPLAQNVGNMLQNMMARGDKPDEPLPDEVFSDLRESGCILPVSSQGDCGSCYAFSALALYEYLFCRATGHKLPFSKQYMVSCGGWTYMRKCIGGYTGAALQFIDRYGMETARDWPYLEEEGTCPHEPGSMGAIRLQKPGFGIVEFQHFDQYLRERPILLSLDPPDEFMDYGGGVYAPSEGCLVGMPHAMVIVGHGRQDGKEYYLFRNSYGSEYGERGYIKFSKEHVRNCTAMLYGFGSSGEFAPDALEQLKAKKPATRSVEVPQEGRWPPLNPNSEAARLLRPVHPDFIEFKKHDPFLHLYPEETLKQVVPLPSD